MSFPKTSQSEATCSIRHFVSCLFSSTATGEPSRAATSTTLQIPIHRPIQCSLRQHLTRKPVISMPSNATHSHSYSAAVQTCHSSFRRHLFSPTFTPLPTLEPVITRLSNLLLRPLSAQSPPLSILLVGPQSSGKTLILSRALATLPDSAQPTIITLHGLLHSSPSTAWRTIASHFSATDPPAHQAECLAIINDHLRTLATHNKPLLFVLDAFHAFACDSSSQSLLYGILNYLQQHTLRAACVAMTNKIDTTSRLEKRVKSRFAAREIVIPLPQDDNQVRQFLTAAIQHSLAPETESMHHPLQNGDPQVPKRQRSDTPATANSSSTRNTKRRRSTARTRGMDGKRVGGHRDEMRGNGHGGSDRSEYDRGMDDYRSVVRMLIDAEAGKAVINRYMFGNRVIEPILRAVDAAMTSAFEAEIVEVEGSGKKGAVMGIEERLSVALQTLEMHLSPADTLSTMVASVSEVELALLIACRRIKGKATFADVIKEYETLGWEKGMVRGEQGEAIADRLVAENCWERLVEGGLVVRNGNGPKALRRVELAVEPELIDKVIQKRRRVSTRLERWAREEFRR